MIEKIKLEELNFSPIEVKKKIKRVLLKETLESVFPFFEKAFRVSLKYDSRAEFSEDEDFINIKLEMDEKLAALRESFKKYGFSSEDEKYMDELNSRWQEYIKEFPVFKGEPFRLFVFWSLSFLDMMGIAFESKYKTVSLVELFFYEKIIDYIVSEKDGIELKEDDVSKIFQRFKAPIDHYRGINLILHNVFIENKETKKKLYEFYELLLPKLKTKIGKWEIILESAKNYISQKEYTKAEKILKENENLLWKIKSEEYLSLLFSYYRNSGEEDKFWDYFNNDNNIKSILSTIPDNNKRIKVALTILSNIELSNKKVKELLYELIINFEKQFKEKVGFLINIYLKQRDFDKAIKVFRRNKNYIKKYSCFLYLQLLIVFYLSYTINLKNFLDEQILKEIILCMHFFERSEIKKVYIIWDWIVLFDFQDEIIKLFLKELLKLNLDKSLLLYRERESLKNFIKSVINKKASTREILSIEDINIYNSKFVFDIVTNFNDELSKKGEKIDLQLLLKEKPEEVIHISKTNSSLIITSLTNFLIEMLEENGEKRFQVLKAENPDYLFLSAVKFNNFVYAITIKKEVFKKQWTKNIDKSFLMAFEVKKKSLLLKNKKKIGRFQRVIAISETGLIALSEIGDINKKVFILDTAFNIKTIVGKNEEIDLELGFPIDVRFDNEENILIVDNAKSIIYKINYSKKKIAFKKELPEYSLRAINFDSDHNLYITSYYNGYIYKINKQGNLVKIIKTNFRKLDGIEILGNKLYIHNTENAEIVEYLI